ncbi:hypothetical protein [Dapis sp. BLCC M229]|uniref:hypothetical protein n=1 Tax=Dapis sp. BLCC M229 TaxID=3400188 RepID=UPI003CEE9AE4
MRPEPPAFSRFQISLGTAKYGLKNPPDFASYLEYEIRQRHSYKSFQQPDTIADAIRLISDKKLWLEVASIMGRTDKDIKQELKIIIDHRNKIAHEADIDPTLSLGNRWAINEIMVGGAVDLIEQVVDSIHSIL